jgi:hypothetical protein
MSFILGGGGGNKIEPIYPDAGYPDRLGPSCKFVENSTKLTWLEITGYRINSVMSSRTSSQAWSKGLDAGTYCK